MLGGDVPALQIVLIKPVFYNDFTPCRIIISPRFSLYELNSKVSDVHSRYLTGLACGTNLAPNSQPVAEVLSELAREGLCGGD